MSKIKLFDVLSDYFKGLYRELGEFTYESKQR